MYFLFSGCYYEIGCCITPNKKLLGAKLGNFSRIHCKSKLMEHVKRKRKITLSENIIWRKLSCSRSFLMTSLFYSVNQNLMNINMLCKQLKQIRQIVKCEMYNLFRGCWAFCSQHRGYWFIFVVENVIDKLTLFDCTTRTVTLLWGGPKSY